MAIARYALAHSCSRLLKIVVSGEWAMTALFGPATEFTRSTASYFLRRRTRCAGHSWKRSDRAVRADRQLNEETVPPYQKRDITNFSEKHLLKSPSLWRSLVTP